MAFVHLTLMIILFTNAGKGLPMVGGGMMGDTRWMMMSGSMAVLEAVPAIIIDAGRSIGEGDFLLVLFAAAFGALVAAFISHRRGIYYALLTIAFGQVFWFVSIKWHAVTGGEDGLLKIRRLPADFRFIAFNLMSNEALFYFCVCIFALAMLLPWRLIHSPLGRILAAIKQNEMRAAFVDYNVWVYKWLSFTISAAVAGLAGALFALMRSPGS